MNSEIIVKPVPGLIWRTLDNETVLIQPNSGRYVIINDVGTFIWELVNKTLPVKEIEREVVHHFAVAPEQAAADIDAFFDSLRQKGLILPENA